VSIEATPALLGSGRGSGFHHARRRGEVITRRSVRATPSGRRLGHEEPWRACETIVAEQPPEGEPLVKQRRFELEAALLLRDLMAISLAVAPREGR
jgi:hypothetical protein